MKDPSGIFYYWNGERPRHANAPKLDGTGEIKIESADRATGYFTTRSDTDPQLSERTSGVYLRADSEDLSILDGRDDRKRGDLIAERLSHWKSIANAGDLARKTDSPVSVELDLRPLETGIMPGRKIVRGEHGHLDVRRDSSAIEGSSLRRPEDLVGETKGPAVRQRSAEYIGEHTLGVFADSRNLGRPAHQRLRQRLARADGQRPGQLHSGPAQRRSGTRPHEARLTRCPLGSIDRITPCLLRIGDVAGTREPRGERETVRIHATEVDPDVDNEPLQRGVGEDCVERRLQRDEPRGEVAFFGVPLFREDSEIPGRVVEMSVLDLLVAPFLGRALEPAVGDGKQQRRSEERRVGKGCRSPT